MEPARPVREPPWYSAPAARATASPLPAHWAWPTCRWTREARQYQAGHHRACQNGARKNRAPSTVKLTDVPRASQLKGMAGQQTVVTLSAVDVGILNITRFATPDPGGLLFWQAPLRRRPAGHLRQADRKDGRQHVAKQRFGGDAGKRDTQSLPRKVRLGRLCSAARWR
jgi:hypothetical protein